MTSFRVHRRLSLGGRSDATGTVAVLLAVPALVIAGLLALVVYLSFRENGVPGGGWTLRNYRALAGDPALLGVLRNTAVYAAVTVGVAMLLGVPMAWLVERTDLGWRRTLHAAMVVRVLVPGMLTALGWLFLAHPRIGAMHRLLPDGFGWLDVTSLAGMGVVEGLIQSSVVFILVATGLRATDSTLEEAARANGAGPGSVFWRVTLPLAYPTLAGAGIFVAVIAVSLLDVPLVLGLGNQVPVFSTYLYLRSRPPDGVLDYGLPAAASSFLILLALGLTWWYTRILARSRRYQVVSGRGFRPARVRLGRWRPVAWLFVGGYFLLATVLPVLFVLWASTQPYVQPPSPNALALASVDTYRELDWSLIWRGAATTAKLMLLAATLTTTLSVGFALVVTRTRLRLRRGYDLAAFLPQAVPSLIFAFSAVLVALYWSRGWYDLYGSLLLLVVVMALVHVAFGSRMLTAGLVGIGSELDEAAAVCGASGWRTLWRVTLPLLRPALTYTWLWLALRSFRDLTIPTVVGSQDTLTLSVVVWSTYTVDGAGAAAATTMVMVALLVPLVAVFLWAGRERPGSPLAGWGV